MSFWDQLVAEFETLGTTLAEWLPRLVVALLVLVVGIWILKWVRKLVVKLLGVGFIDGIFDRAGINKALEPSDQDAAGITGTVVYAYLYVALWLTVFRIIEIGSIVDLLERLLAWIPLVLLAAVVIVVAAAVASWTADLVAPFAETKGVGWLGVLVRVAVILFGVLFALDLLNITFAADLTKIATFAVGAAFAIAFGVGGIDAGKLWWKKYGSPKDGGGQPPSSYGS
ncbi:MAG: hypothetical protein ACC654_00770 [Acidimicrobiia bacterium]